MMFRLTQKAADKVRVSCEAVTSAPVPMLEWYCNLVVVARKPLLLFTHAVSLFSFWAPAAGCKAGSFGDQFRGWASDVLIDYGFSADVVAKLIDDEPDAFAKSVDRGVIGSMVDYAKMLQQISDNQGGRVQMSPREMNDVANECPMSRLKMEAPIDCLRDLMRTAGSA